jgi:hypothetical protein
MEMPDISWVTDKQIPSVDPADIKALHKVLSDMFAGHAQQPGMAVGLNPGAVAKLLTPGADINIVLYRLAWLGQFQAWSLEQASGFPWAHDGKVDDAVFKALAIVPMTGIPNEGITSTPFDMDELVRLIQSGGEEK